MGADSELYDALSGDSSITAIVGDRIYSDIRDQGDKVPSIFFERSGTEFIHALSSYVPLAQRATFTLTSFQTTRELSDSLTSLVITATAAANFLCNDKQNSYDEETQTYYTTIQLNYLDN